MPKYKVKANISLGYKDFAAGEEYELTKDEIKAIGLDYLEEVEETKKPAPKNDE
jgi:hypothetical protein